MSKPLRKLAVICAVLSIGFFIVASSIPLSTNRYSAVAQEEAPADSTAPQVVNASEAAAPATPTPKTTIVESSEPPIFSEELQTEFERELNETFAYPEDLIRETTPVTEEISPPPPANTSSFAFASPPILNETEFRDTIVSKSELGNSTIANSTNSTVKATSDEQPLANPFRIYRSTTVSPTVYRSAVSEPSVASNGPIVFLTGNWYAARSSNYGTSWAYVNPMGDMSDFCCDQDVLYDKNNKIWLWYRQGISDSNGDNRFRLGVSKDASSWWFYNIKATNFNAAWAGTWFDYPQLALGNNYLYIATNMFDKSSSYERTLISRWNLNQLSTASAVSFTYYTTTGEFNFVPVQGATTTMYFAVHHSNSQMILYKWPETSSSISIYTRNIPAWTFGNRDTMVCPGPDGLNWCARSDSRITGGFVKPGVVGWYWNAKQGAGFPYPYINAATFRDSDLAYIGRPFLWSSAVAWMYGFMAPRPNGDLGIVAFYGGGSYYPNFAAGVADVYSGTPPPYQMYNIVSSTNGAQRWGDYDRVRLYAGSNLGPWWEASGYSMQGCSDNPCAQPRFVVFGR
jgi:hypothetical protein